MDLSTLTLNEVVNDFQAIEQRGTLGHEEQTERALIAKHMEILASIDNGRGKKQAEDKKGKDKQKKQRDNYKIGGKKRIVSTLSTL